MEGRARADSVARTVGGPLRSFPKEFNHPPAPRGQGRSKVVEPGYGVCGRSGSREGSLQGGPFSCMQPIVNRSDSCARGRCAWEAVGCSLNSWQPGLGVGRYGESVPLLLISRTTCQRSCLDQTDRRTPGRHYAGCLLALQRSLATSAGKPRRSRPASTQQRPRTSEPRSQIRRGAQCRTRSCLS